MSHAPFVMKLAFYPSTKQNRQRNVCHVRYIATRPGADCGELEPEKEDPGTAAGHVKYAGERPGSHGLFGPEEGVTPDLKATQEELRSHKGIVWRAVLSLREDDAVRLGYTTRKAWETLLRATVAEAATKMGIPESNLRWVAAFHAAQGHPHVHLIWWEKNPARTRGMLSEGEKRDLRRVFVREIYAEERSRLLAEKTAIRDLLRETARQDVLHLAREIRQARLEVRALAGGEPGIAPVLNPAAGQELAGSLSGLAAIMPGHGRAALAYMPVEVKTRAKEIADWLLQQPGFSQSARRYQELARQLASQYTLKPEALDEAARKAYEDIRDRVAQVVLKGAAQVQRLEQQVEPASEVAGELPSEEGLSGGKYMPVIPEKSAKRLWRTTCRAVDRAYLQVKPGAGILKPKLEKELEQRIAVQLQEFAKAMPDPQGKPAFACLPEELKEQARAIAAGLLNREELQERLAVIAAKSPEKAGRLLEHITEQVVARAYDLIPREIPEIDMVLHPGRGLKAAYRIMNARAAWVKDDRGEACWTAGTIYRAMVRLGEEDMAREAAARFGKEAGLSEGDIDRVINNEIKRMEEFARRCQEKGVPEPRHVSRADWQRLTENLGLEEHEMPTPWFGIKKPGPEYEQKQELREQLNVLLVEERIASALTAIREAGDRPDDPGELRWTLVTMTSTLKALGVDEAGREEMVRGWCRRAGVEITEARLLDVLDRATIGQDDLWLGRRSWDRLMANLGVDEAPASPWEINIPRPMVRNTGIAHDVWKAAWRALERERTRAEAQAQLLAERDLERRRRKAREEGKEMERL